MENLNDLKKLLSSPKDIVITSHRNPDGDAIGSSLGLLHYLRRQGHSVKVATPSEYPDFLDWMPGAREIYIHDLDVDETNNALKKAAASIDQKLNDCQFKP